MPKEWYDRHSALAIEDSDLRSRYISILADKKPYFMRYIYSDLMRQYNSFVGGAESKVRRQYGMTADELLAKPAEELSDEERGFVHYYERCIPVGMGDCTMNRICRKVEQEFDKKVRSRIAESKFDYSVLKSETEYSETRYKALRRLYSDFNSRLRDYTIFVERERVDDDSASEHVLMMREEFERECINICTDRDELCNIAVDMCYKSNNSKSFVWTMCISEIIKNLARNGDGEIHYPVRDPDGEVEFGGEKYAFHSKVIEV